MPFVMDEQKKKKPSAYRSLYISQDLIEKIEQIAKENDTSFNNVVVTMIRHCLEEE